MRRAPTAVQGLPSFNPTNANLCRVLSVGAFVAPTREREKRLSLKVKRLGQLQKMLAASVFLERPAHLAIAISIWRRYDLLLSAAL